MEFRKFFEIALETIDDSGLDWLEDLVDDSDGRAKHIDMGRVASDTTQDPKNISLGCYTLILSDGAATMMRGGLASETVPLGYVRELLRDSRVKN